MRSLAIAALFAVACATTPRAQPVSARQPAAATAPDKNDDAAALAIKFPPNREPHRALEAPVRYGAALLSAP